MLNGFAILTNPDYIGGQGLLSGNCREGDRDRQGQREIGRERFSVNFSSSDVLSKSICAEAVHMLSIQFVVFFFLFL